MKRFILSFALLTCLFTTKIVAQNFNIGTGYNSINHDGYDLIFNTNTLKSIHLGITSDITELPMKYQLHFEHYTLQEPKIVFDNDTLMTTTGLMNFGLDFGFEYTLNEENKIRPYASAMFGAGSIYANQETYGNDTDVGNSYVRASLELGVKYLITKNRGIGLSYQSILTYYLYEKDISPVENRKLFTQSYISLSYLYFFY
jgi:hypothetical protein